MPNPTLSKDQLKTAWELIADVRGRLEELSGDDPNLLFAYRRKLAKELGYDERGRPGERTKLKRAKWDQQNRLCAECGDPLALPRAELDRYEAIGGYTIENTDLVHGSCHHKRQAAKGYR